ncbi:hypothetical protein KIJ96_17985 [Pseudoalteromonas piscicida]|uniref:DUF5666 domain-containing protein n=1 Tax=Pseudoalteromonas TaxID=53246 RepID=UPI00157228EF|nr:MULTISPECIES: DUF5666 domain-containing protein [Pseudoalteromonas]NSY32645.1 hypothetical protein [Pseudoalteromonas sp. JC28]UDM61650.1 hypothetical protein KIJ96_17985 [Pseudoalteromonas piscicida]
MDKKWLLPSLLASSSLLVACGGGSGSDTDPQPGDNTGTKGSIKVIVQGLPAGADAGLTLTGPSSYSEDITSTTTLNALANGEYKLTATSRSVDQALYQPNENSVTVDLSGNEEETITITYRTSVSAQGTVTGFGSVYVNGVRYETTPDQQANLKVGMLINLQGKQGADGNFAVADSIIYDATAKGVVTAVDYAKQTITVLGQEFSVDKRTKLEVAFTEITTGDFVEISALHQGQGQYVATRIDVEEQNGEFEIEGKVAELDLDAKTFKLGMLTIDYSQATEVEGTLENNAIVEVEASSLPIDGVLLADSVEVDSNEPVSTGAVAKFEGIVTQVSDDTFAIGGHSFTLNDDTDFKKGDDDDLQIGMRVFVLAVATEEGLIAKKVRFDKHSEIELTGVVEDIDLEAQTLTVFGSTYFVDSYTQFEDDSDAEDIELKLEKLSVGDVVEIEAFGFEGAYVVRDLERISASDFDDQQEHEVEGKITAVNAGEQTITVGKLVFAINGATELELEDDVNLTTFFEQVAAGDIAEVDYVIQGDSLIATKVEVDDKDDDFDDRRFELEGKVVSFNPVDATFSVDGKTVFFDGNTEFKNGLFVIGDEVEVTAIQRADGSILALKIEIESDDGIELEVEGKITNFVSASEFMVNGVSIATDGNTEFKDGSSSNLGNGVTVEVEGVLTDDNVLLAKKVEFEEDDVDEVEIAGLIEDLVKNSAFDYEFNLGAQRVQITADTKLKNGNFEKFSNGLAVEVEGYTTDGVTVIAKELKFEAVKYVEVEGPITQVETDEAFYVLGQKVKVSEQTQFKGGSQSDIATGKNVEVEGYLVTKNGETYIQAEKVEFEDYAYFELEGKVANLSGDQFTLFGMTVHVTNDTVFKDGQKSDLSNDVKVEVTAQMVEGTIIALEVDFED